MDETLATRLSEVVGADDTAFSPLERGLYSHDAAPLPSFLSRLFKTLPDAIVRPESAGEVAQLLRIASEHKIPVVPRAAGTWSLGGTTPVKGGIVLDLVKLSAIGDSAPDGSWIDVDAGVVWQDLIRHLHKEGLTVLSYPTSALASTVGGWVSTGGYGIGSLAHGHIGGQIEALEVVTPPGRVIKLSRDSVDPKMQWFVGTEGQFGVITKVRLRVRKKPERVLVRGVYAPKGSQCLPLLGDLSALGDVVCALKVLDSGLMTLKSALGSGGRESRSLVLAVLEGSPEEVRAASAALEQTVARRGLQLCDDAAAAAEWQDRYWPLRIGRLGPTVLGGETVVPLRQLEPVMREIASLGDKYGARIGVEVHVISKDQALVLAMYLADEREPFKYLVRLSLIRDIVKVGSSHGGVPYGVGLWNAVYIKQLFSKEDLAVLERVKKKLDPQSIMNPGKFFKAETRFKIPIGKIPYAVAMNTLGVARRFQ